MRISRYALEKNGYHAIFERFDVKSKYSLVGKNKDIRSKQDNQNSYSF